MLAGARSLLGSSATAALAPARRGFVSPTAARLKRTSGASGFIKKAKRRQWRTRPRVPPSPPAPNAPPPTDAWGKAHG